MSSRTVSVVLTAQVQNYLSNMKAAEQRTLEVERASRNATQQFAAHNAAIHQLGVGMLAVGATAAAGLALAVKASADFGAKMAQLQSLSHANAATMKQLSDAAMSVGTAYGFSATQVADAEIELTKAGISVQAQLGGALKGALTLAAAGQMDVAQATEITTVAMTQFALKASDVPHVADLLAAGADKALGSVADLGEGLKNGGLQAHNMGLSIDDTIGLLSAFANAGILGAEAGTQMRSMFLRLQNPTAGAKKVMEEYGIAINDASGKFVGISKFATELHDKLDGLTQAQRNQALATMFGSHAIVGATVLYQDGGAAAEKAGNSIGDWITKVNASGFASAQAAGKMNSLQGDTQKLAAVFQTDLIKAGSGANDMLRGLTQGATGALNVFGQIPGPVLSVGVGITALVAGVGLVGGAALIAVPKIVAFRAALSELEISGRATVGAIGKGGALLTGIAAVGAGFANTATQGEASSQQITRSAQVMAGKWKDLGSLFKGDGGFFETGGFKQALHDEQLQSGSAKFLDGLTFGITHFSDVYKQNEGAFSAMGQQLAGLSKQNYGAAATSFGELVSKYHLGADEQRRLLGTMPAYRDALVELAGKAHIAATDQNLLALASGKGAVGQKALAFAAAQAKAAAESQATALAKLSGSGNDATQSIAALQGELKGLGQTTVGAKEAEISFQQAIEAATAAAAKGRRGLDLSTQAGQENQHVLDNITTSAGASAAALLANGGSAAQAAAKIREARKHFVDAATAMTGSRKEANRLADAMHLIPGDITSIIKIAGADAAQNLIDRIKAGMNNLQGTRADVYINAVASGIPTGRAAQISKNAGFADGGEMPNIGPKGQDSFIIAAGAGEHMWSAKDVDAVGGQSAMYRVRAAARAGQLQGFADGGAISEDQHAASTASRELTKANRDLARAKREKAAADEKAKTASDRAARIYGKGTAKAKHEASLEARAAHEESAAASKAEAAAQKAADKAKTARDNSNSRVAALKQNSEDFVSAQTRATPNSPIDPLNYVDQLRSMSRDSNFSSSRRSAFDAASQKYEASLVKLQTKATDAATALGTLKDSSKQMHDSITQSISGSFGLSGAASAQTASGWMMRDGMRFQTTSGGPTASSIAGYYQAGAGTAQQFASALKQLAGRGLNTQLLAELAGMGTDQGLPIAQAILSGSDADLQSINGGYSSIAASAGAAGTTVADANYAAQIAAADANAQQITDAIATQGESLRKIIATAFGLKGYATGTRSASPGLHWVGEHGPELAGFAGGETVLTAPDSRRWVRGAGGMGGGTPSVTVQAPPVRMPDTITVQDLHGFTAQMRVVATQEIARDSAHNAVLMMGGATV